MMKKYIAGGILLLGGAALAGYSTKDKGPDLEQTINSTPAMSVSDPADKPFYQKQTTQEYWDSLDNGEKTIQVFEWLADAPNKLNELEIALDQEWYQIIERQVKDTGERMTQEEQVAAWIKTYGGERTIRTISGNRVEYVKQGSSETHHLTYNSDGRVLHR